jgi:two-component sensor histidine kinase
LAELLTRILAPYTINKQCLTIVGPSVLLPINAVLPLSLAFHELATNAVKYGAWAAETGVVEVKWECCNDTLNLTWSEFDGPLAKQETHSGFGWILIHRMLTAAPGAECRLDMSSGGLRCAIKYPL